MWIILTTDISGSGESVVLNVLEDTGYYCVDNPPAQFIPELARYLADQSYTHLGMATDIRSRESLRKVPETVTVLCKEHDIRILLLAASTTALVQRYSRTRHRHPLSIHNGRPGTAVNVQVATKGPDASLIETIEMERELLSPLVNPAHRIDASMLHMNALCVYIREFISDEPHDITLMFESLGFKYGMPADTDLVFDVRSLPNPYYDTQSRPLTGRDQPVINFLQSQSMMLAMAEDTHAYVEKWLPSFIANNRGYLTVAIDYIGSQHRPVYVAERLAMYFRAHGNMLIHHRELAVGD